MITRAGKIISLFTFVGGWVGILLFVFGIPGHITNAHTWLMWLRVLLEQAGLVIPIGMVITSPLVWKLGAWWPPVSRWISRIRSQQNTASPESNSLSGPVSVEGDSAQVKKFRELEPLITRHHETLRPIRSLVLLWSFDALGFRADREELVAHLDALKIPYPPYDSDRSIWFHYLVGLEASCQTGDLQEARSLYQETDARQPDTDQ